MSTFDEYGMIIDTQPIVQAALEDLFKASFGDNIKLDSLSVFGQLIKNISISIAQINELIEDVALSINPQAASGAALSNLVLLNGIQRNQGIYSSAILSITADRATTVPSGSIVEDDLGFQWATDSDLIFAGAGVLPISATCLEIGPIEASAGTLVTIKTPIYGWTAVTNATAATIGSNEETDAELRLRRQIVAERSSSTSVSAIYAAVSDITGINSVSVLVNNGTVTDVDGIPPQHILVIADGVSSDNEAEFAEAIFTHTSAGIGFAGNKTIEYYDSVTDENYDINYFEPELVGIYISLTVVQDIESSITFSPTEIADSLVAYFDAIKIGQDVIFTRLYTPINENEGFYITAMLDGIGVADGTTNISIGRSERACLLSLEINGVEVLSVD